MADKYLLGVDVGTYETKGVITNLKGEVLSTQVSPHEMLIPQQGWAEHDPEGVWWGDFVSVTKRLIESSGVNPKDILAVGCSAIGICVLPIDKDGLPLRKGGILYGVDTRATEEIAYLEKEIGTERIFDKAGMTLSSQAAAPKIMWLKNNEPEVYKKAHKFVTATTFIVGRLTGNYVVDHLTGSFVTPLYDFQARKWTDELTSEIVELDRLPELRWASEIAGTVTAEAAQQTGLLEGTPVTVGTADAAAEAVSVGVTNPGQMMLMYGSTIFIIEVLDKPIADERMWANPYLFEGTSALLAGMATSGSLTRWFRDQLAPELTLFDLDGNEVSLKDFPGEVILVNNWATWCPPCREEMPEFKAYYDKYKDQGFQVVAIEAGEPEAEVRDFVEGAGLDFVILLDPENKSLLTFQQNSLPNSFVIDRQGNLRLAWLGTINGATLEKYVTPLLKE